MQRVIKSIVLALGLYSMQASAMILPPNHLDRFDRLGFTANITQAQFNDISDRIIAIYQPMAKLHGAVLSVNKNWSDSTVNAYAHQDTSTDWQVDMYGGLARRAEVTLDGFALVVCHELGHHFGGYFFYEDSTWAAGEGQADYFATQVCAKKVFKTVLTEMVNPNDVPTIVKQKCDSVWTNTADKNICYRTAAAGFSLAQLLAVLGGTPATYETPDPSEVAVSSSAHPEAQCRLDTYVSGALCKMTLDETVIPGKTEPNGMNSPAAEAEAAKNSCFTKEGFALGVRPLCWFKPVR